MSLVSLNINETWRDYYAQWNAKMLPAILKLEESKCLAPRICIAPPLAQGAIPSSGKLLYNFHLVPGSIIFGFLGAPSATSIQLTDVGIGHQLFQEPLSPATFGILNPDTVDESFFLLPCPWPVTGDGLFTLEIWGTVGDLVGLYMYVAEVTTCPVR